MLRVALVIYVTVVATLAVGAFTRVGTVIWSMGPNHGLHDGDLAAGLVAGGLAWLVTRPR